jgi:hypothetical protein
MNLNNAGTDGYLKFFPELRSEGTSELSPPRPYSSIQEFRVEVGKVADEATIAEYEQYVYVPIDVNNADAETLQQIPGVTDEIAQKLIAARPYASNDEFLMTLSAHLSPDDVTFGQNFLSTPDQEPLH